MSSTFLIRRLPATISSRPIASCITTNNLPRFQHKPLQSRHLSQTPYNSSSSFRLSSNNNNNNNNNNTTQTPEHHTTTPDYSAYKPKRQWPPDMSKLSPKHQFRLERKYRRRAALKFARPKWTKGTKLVQWGVIGFVLVYAVLFMEWDDKGSPFDELRRAFFAGVKGTFSAPPPPGPVKRSDDS